MHRRSHSTLGHIGGPLHRVVLCLPVLVMLAAAVPASAQQPPIPIPPPGQRENEDLLRNRIQNKEFQREQLRPAPGTPLTPAPSVQERQNQIDRDRLEMDRQRLEAERQRQLLMPPP